jgi:ectoine hydroxylase-related dioxygenase (phytanoyl-CoA dioxygenase family)
MITVTAKAGSVIFFRGNLIHAGAGSTHDNVRIHAYLDTDITKGRGEADTRYYCDTAAGVIGALPLDTDPEVLPSIC